MDLTPYVESLRRDLLAAAGADEQTHAVAERLGYALEPAARLALMEAVSHAAAEITAEMAGGGVDVRLDGRDLDFVVHGGVASVPAPPAPPVAPAPPAPPEADEDGGVARITLRLPEHLKNKAEEAAAGAGHSLNTWLVNVVRDATREGAARVDVDLSSLPLTGGVDPFGHRAGRRTTGWL